MTPPGHTVWGGRGQLLVHQAALFPPRNKAKRHSRAPLQLDAAIRLNSDQEKAGGSDISHFQFWPMKPVCTQFSLCLSNGRIKRTLRT